MPDFRWDHAIAARRKIFQQDFPTDVTGYLFEAENLGFGLELSPAVQQASDRVYTKLVSLISQPTQPENKSSVEAISLNCQSLAASSAPEIAQIQTSEYA